MTNNSTFCFDELLEADNSMNTDDRINGTSGMDNCIPFGNAIGICHNRIIVPHFTDLFQVAVFVGSRGMDENGQIYGDRYQLNDVAKQTFQALAKLRDNLPVFFRALLDVYDRFFGVDLHVIAMIEGEYRVINKNGLFKPGEEQYVGGNQAFLGVWLTADSAAYAPLFIYDHYGREKTIFEAKDENIRLLIKNFVHELNQTAVESRTYEQHVVNTPQGSLEDLSVDNISTMSNHSNPAQSNILPIYDDFRQIPLEILEQFDQCELNDILTRFFQMEGENMPRNDGIVLPDNITPMEMDNQHISGQSSALSIPNSSFNYTTSPDEMGPALQNDRTPAVTAPATPMHLSSSTQTDTNFIVDVTTLTQFRYEPPWILREPKEVQRCRNALELGKGQCSRVQGNGPNQRAPVQVQPPPRREGQSPLYLSMEVLTHDDQKHPSKKIFPNKTKVAMDLVSHENNVNCFRFNECDPTDHYDQDTGCIHSEISSAEHQGKPKDVWIYMIKLYQNAAITKKLIEDGQLHLCKLAFWLSEFKNEIFQPVSSRSFSTMIREPGL